MVLSTSRLDPYDEGYPRSSEADLDPGTDFSESLDDADRVASDEHRVVPGGRRPMGSRTTRTVTRTPMTATMRGLATS
jgi:hypothetical protein